MSSKKSDKKKAPDMKGQHTLFSALENAKKNVGSYQLQMKADSDRDRDCTSHDLQALQNAFDDFIRELVALLDHRVSVQGRLARYEEERKRERRIKHEVQADMPTRPPSPSPPLSEPQEVGREQDRAREQSLQASVRQAGLDYLRVIRGLVAMGRCPPTTHLGHVFRLVVGRLERHGVTELAQEGATMMVEVVRTFPSCLARSFEGVGAEAPSQFLALYPDAWNHLVNYTYDQEKEDATQKKVRSAAEPSETLRAVYRELDFNQAKAFELLPEMIEALNSAALQLQGEDDSEGTASDPSPLNDLALLLNLRIVLEVLERDLEARTEVLETAATFALSQAGPLRKDPPTSLLTSSLLWRAVTESRSASFEHVLRHLLRALGWLGRAEAQELGEEEAEEVGGEGEAFTPLKSAPKTDRMETEDEEEIVVRDSEDDEEEATGTDVGIKRTRNQTERAARDAAEAALLLPKETGRVEAETEELRGAFCPSDLFQLGSRMLTLLLTCYSTGERHGLFEGGGKTRGTGATKNLRVVLDKTIAEAVSSRSLPFSATSARAAVIRAVRDPVEIARVVSNVIAWRMARRASDERDFPSLFAVRGSFETDGMTSQHNCADLEEALRYIEEDGEKMVKVFGAGGLRFMLAHVARAVLTMGGVDSKSDAQKAALLQAFANACSAALDARPGDEKGAGAVWRAGKELAAVKKLVAA